MAYTYEQKREIIEKIDDSEMQEFFHEQESLFFPNIDEMTPLQKIDNTLAQIYNLYSIRLQNQIISQYSIFQMELKILI